MTACFSEHTPESQSIRNNLMLWKSTSWQSTHSSDHASEADIEPLLPLQPTQSIIDSVTKTKYDSKVDVNSLLFPCRHNLKQSPTQRPV